jgi:predicted acylesterase/phospholipase RssA
VHTRKSADGALKRVALALSSGGMFGGYQAGVWKELETLIRPDAVLGASIGSLNGWAIAGGASADELRDWWLRFGDAHKLALRFPKGWLTGIVDSGRILAQIEALHRAYPRQIDFGVVLTELPRFRPRLFVNDQVDWRHLAASCAVIGVLPMHRFDKRIYADGGLLDPRPLSGFSHFNIDVVIGVNVLPIRPRSAYGAMIKSLQWVTRYAPRVNVSIVEVGPEQFLGGLGDAVRFKRENFDRWFEQGREAMRKQLPLLETILR